jgi:hypothetical protein
VTTNALRQILNYSSPDASTSAARPHAAVFDGAMPEAVAIKCLDTYQSELLIRKRVLRHVRYQFSDDKAQALAALRLEETISDRRFAANSLWFENRNCQCAT